MKKLLVSLLLLSAVKINAQVTYPNITTNVIPTLNFIINYFRTNNNVWSGSNFFGNVYVDNVRLSTNYWNGPTNTIDLRKASQDYTTYTPMEITGLDGVIPGFQGNVILNITNAANTNVIMYLASNVTSDDGGRAYYVTNGTYRSFSLRQTPTQTNNVSRTMF